MSVQGNLSIGRMCQLAGVSRTSFYRSLAVREPVEENMEVRSAIQRIFAEHKRRYGYRRVSKELRRGGMLVNRKRVQRLMRQDNLLAVQPKAFVVTTDSHHDLEVYLNLASRMKLTGINQLWVADITYIRLHHEWVFLAVILDAFSRKVVGWELDRTLAARLPMAALEKAIADRNPPPGVAHHSDRGVQYASGSYVALLRKHGMIPSMSRPANPYDNASCESFMKTLKREEIYANQYRDLDHLRANIAEFIDHYYNRVRLHSALGYQPPEEFEQSIPPSATSQGATMSFFRHEEIFQSDGGSTVQGEPAETGPPDHRLDESPAGYSSTGCSPAEPASASPAEDHCGGEQAV
jgi:transposase InsO family protein